MKVKIIFGSEIGTTAYMAELLKKRFDDKNHQADMYQVGLEGYDPDIKGYDLLLFGSPTYFEGQLQSDMTIFTERFKADLSSYKIAVFSLGDSAYSDFCGSAEILEKWVKSLGGNVVVPTLKVDGYPKNFSEYTQWVNQIIDKCGA